MKSAFWGTLVAAVVFAGSLTMAADPAHALSCPQRDFTRKVQASKNIVIGEIIRPGLRDRGKTTVRIVKILKNGGLFRRGQRTFVVSPSRMSPFSFRPRRGQLVLFFFYGNQPRWTCMGPMLIR